MKCPVCNKEMTKIVFLYICVNCDLALTEQEINKAKKYKRKMK